MLVGLPLCALRYPSRLTTGPQVLGDSGATLYIAPGGSNTTVGATNNDGLATICFSVNYGSSPSVQVFLHASESAVVQFAFYAEIGTYCTTPPHYEPPTFLTVSVQSHTSDFAVMGADGGKVAYLALNTSSAVAVPAQDFIFSSGSAIFKMETQLSDSQYLTSSGLCSFGNWCSVPDGSLSYMVEATETLSLPERSHLQNGELVNIHVGDGMGLTTTGGEIVMGFNYDRVFISEYDIGRLEVTPAAFTDIITLKDFTVWPQSNEEIKLSYHVGIGQDTDFYTYNDCDDGDVAFECGHLFDFSFDFSDFFRVFDAESPSSLDRLRKVFSAPKDSERIALEQPAFELFV